VRFNVLTSCVVSCHVPDGLDFLGEWRISHHATFPFVVDGIGSSHGCTGPARPRWAFPLLFGDVSGGAACAGAIGRRPAAVRVL